MEVLQLLSGPLLGALIGYCTNYIAVKMLFLPRREWRVFGRRLPFTPGIIPRRKDALADAVGGVVARQLFTADTLCAMLGAAEVENAVSASIVNALCDQERTLAQLGAVVPDSGAVRARLEGLIVERMCAVLDRADLATLIAREGKAIAREKLGALGAMFVTDELMASLGASAQERVRAYAAEHREDLCALLHGEIDHVGALTSDQAVAAIGVTEQDAFMQVRVLYRSLIAAFAPALCERLPIAQEIAARIRAMSARELEVLVLSVMRRELNAVVNLGALVGFVLGLLNLLFH